MRKLRGQNKRGEVKGLVMLCNEHFKRVQRGKVWGERGGQRIEGGG